MEKDAPAVPTDQSKPNNFLKGCLIALGVMVLLGCGTFTAFWVWLSSGPEGGTRLGYQMEEYAIIYQEDNELLADNEEVKAYYDYTLSLDGSESVYVTDARVFYQKDGQVEAIPIADVTEITYKEESITGYTINVTGESNQRLQIEIAAYNNGDVFLDVLESEVELQSEGSTELESN